ncbi:hypothetical protein D3C80_985370 [compost metagenome]
MQHHHRAKDRALRVADRGQAVGEQARFFIDLHVQVVRRPVQAAAAQHLAQLLLQFRALQGLGQAAAHAAVVPAQLALRHRVEVLQAALVVDDQQAVVDAVEHGLQPLLAGQQLVDVGGLVLAQGIGHEAEAAGQLVQLGGLGDWQGDVEITFAQLVGRLGQGFDRLAEPPGDVVRGNKAQYQHHQSHQAKHTTDQQGAVPGAFLATGDQVQGLPVGVDQVGTHLVEGRTQRLVDTHAASGCGAVAIGLEERLVIAAGLAETGALTALLQALIEQGLEVVLQHPQALRRRAFVKDQGELFAKVLPQLQAHFQGVSGLLYQPLLHRGHLQHAEQAQHKPEQGHRDQRRDAEEKPRAQLHGWPLHRLYCLRLRYSVEASIPKVLAAWSKVSLAASTAPIWARSSSSRLSAAPTRGALPAGCSPMPRWLISTRSCGQMMLARSTTLRSSRMLPGQR